MLSLRSNVLFALCAGAAIFLSPTPASAHFVLDAPASWSVVDMGGGPEKIGPCGNELNPTLNRDDAGQPVVTTFQEGQMITVTITEATVHPGHYRVALSLNGADASDTVQASFPADPTPTAGPTNSGSMVCPNAAMSACGSIPVVSQTPARIPEGWILGDNLNEHCTVARNVQKSFQVALPPGVTCKECVLQVIEFMSDHPAPCFYHHCANISIQGAGNGSDASAPSDATVGADASSGMMSSGSVASTGTVVSSGSAVSGVASGSIASSGTRISSGSVGSGVTGGGSSGSSPATNSAPPSNSSSGCSVSRAGAPSAMVLAWLAVAAGIVPARRRRRPK